MEEQFAPYEQALALKELGFDEPCLGKWLEGTLDFPNPEFTQSQSKVHYIYNGSILAPLWQQAFDWFRKQYGLHGTYTPLAFEVLERDNDFVEWGCVFEGYPEDNFESARINCFNKIVEMIKEKS